MGFTFCPAQIPLTAFAATCGGAPTVTGTITGNVPHELIACKVTLYAPAPVKVNCGSKVVAPVPPLKVTDVLPPQAVLLAAASQLYRVEQLLGLVLVLSVVLTSGVHPVVGESVKAGCGGASTQMQCVMLSTPQMAFPTFSFTQYVPAWSKRMFGAWEPVVQPEGAVLPLVVPNAPSAVQPIVGVTLQTTLGGPQVGASLLVAVLVKLTGAPAQLVSADMVKSACGLSLIHISEPTRPY